jgi:hypothetical protein
VKYIGDTSIARLLTADGSPAGVGVLVAITRLPADAPILRRPR